MVQWTAKSHSERSKGGGTLKNCNILAKATWLVNIRDPPTGLALPNHNFHAL